MITSRRSFLTGLGAVLVAAPAIVRAGSLMPVRVMIGTPVTHQVRITGLDVWGNTIHEYVDRKVFHSFLSDDAVDVTSPFANFKEIIGVSVA